MLSYLALGGAALLVAIDQLIKYWAVQHLAPVHTIGLIPGVLQLTYVENYGAAFGILQQKTFFLIGLTAMVLLVGIILLAMRKLKAPMLIISIMLMIGGGAGNLVDRVFRRFVVDYLDISPLFRFPVFNFADCCVVIGTVLLFVYIVFFEGKKQKDTSGELQGDNPPESTENQ